MDLRRVNHLVVLEAAVSVAVDFTEVVLAVSEVTELMVSAVALVQVEVILAVMALVVLTAVKVRIFMRRLLSALMKLLLAVRCCDHYNVASAKTIRANGGVLEDECFDSSDGMLTQRYWIQNK